ncbi:MAG: DUF2085 domain-containing protein [Planctomycetota bacterium]
MAGKAVENRFVARASASTLSLLSRGGCHRIPERCPRIGGKRLPLCSRCLGVLVGHVSALAFVVVGTVPPLWVCAACGIIGFADWSAQRWFARAAASNGRRFIAGVLAGYGVGVPFWLGVSLVVLQ